MHKTYKELHWNGNTDHFLLVIYLITVGFLNILVTISIFYLFFLFQSIHDFTQHKTDNFLPKGDTLHSVSLIIYACCFLSNCFIFYVILTFRYCRIKHQLGHQPEIKWEVTCKYVPYRISSSHSKLIQDTQFWKFGKKHNKNLWGETWSDFKHSATCQRQCVLRCSYFNTWWLESRIITNATYECFKMMLDTVPK